MANLTRDNGEPRGQQSLLHLLIKSVISVCNFYYLSGESIQWLSAAHPHWVIICFCCDQDKTHSDTADTLTVTAHYQ